MRPQWKNTNVQRDMRLDTRDSFPSGMEDYLSQYGWHFSKKMCEWAVSKMYKLAGKDKAYITPWTKEEVDSLLDKYNVKIDKIGYDYVYAANMCKADYFGSSIADEGHVAMFVKDYIGDSDGYEEMPFTRFYADCIGKGCPISWEDMI